MLKNFLFESDIQINTIIDKTIYEACHVKTGISDKKLNELAIHLKSMGVHIFEVNSFSFSKIVNLPSEWFMLNIEHKKDIDLCIESGIKRCLLKFDRIIEKTQLDKLKKNGISICTEVKADSIEDAEDVLKYIEADSIDYIDVIRFTGLLNYESESWKNIIVRFHRLKIKVDLCPDNSFHMANAVAFDGINDGANSITASFYGFGEVFNYVPLEELIISDIVLRESEITYNLTALPQVSNLFCEITGTEVEDNKPVIGSSIFTVESGIHTHGIDKCSMTYEPYAPELVGQERKIKIGKHSGRKSIERKLEELGFDTSKYNLANILEAVRDKSIQLKRDLYDDDLKSLLLKRDVPDTDRNASCRGASLFNIQGETLCK